jgi:antitoxin component of RelBE/YafQ-DinJ toxin-antitoxin module
MKDTQLTIRINSELKQQAQEHAENTGRTLAGLIEWLLRQEIKKADVADNRQEGRK